MALISGGKGQARTLCKHRDDNHVPLQRRCKLLTHVVVLAFAFALFQQFHPAWPDNGEKHLALAERLIEFHIEALARDQTIDVHEDVCRPEHLSETVADAARTRSPILTAITDENSVGHGVAPKR